MEVCGWVLKADADWPFPGNRVALGRKELIQWLVARVRLHEALGVGQQARAHRHLHNQLWTVLDSSQHGGLCLCMLPTPPHPTPGCSRIFFSI